MGFSKVYELDGKKAADYAGFTYAPYRTKLERAGTDGTVIAVGAEAMGTPAGLVLAERNLNGVLSILSLKVAENLRSKGIGRELISKIEEISLEKGEKKIVAEYAGGKPHTPVIEHILEKRGWTQPITKSVVYRCSARDRGPEEIPWWLGYRLDRLPEGILPWNELAGEELRALRNAGWLPRGLSPFINEEMVDARHSFGLRIKGEIAGWIIYHTIRKDTTVCRSLFIREDVRDKGFAPVMVIQSIRLQYEDGIKNFMFTIHNNNGHVLPMVRRWMERYIVSAAEWREVEKGL